MRAADAGETEGLVSSFSNARSAAIVLEETGLPVWPVDIGGSQRGVHEVGEGFNVSHPTSRDFDHDRQSLNSRRRQEKIGKVLQD
jgi:hypothetical protein